MDPTMTLQLALEAIAEDNREDAIEHLEALSEWLRKGGFLPTLDDLSIADLLGTISY